MSLYQLARDGATDELASYLSESDTAAIRARAAELLGDAADADDDAVETLIAAAADDAAPECGERPSTRLTSSARDLSKR